MLTINIGVNRRLPVINGFVMIPGGQQFLRTKLTPIDVIGLIPGSSLIRMGARGTGIPNITVLDPTSFNLKESTARLHSRLYIELPEYDRLEGPPQDWFTLLRSVAEEL